MDSCKRIKSGKPGKNCEDPQTDQNKTKDRTKQRTEQNKGQNKTKDRLGNPPV